MSRPTHAARIPIDVDSSALRIAGAVSSRRDGTFMHYRASDTHLHRLLAEALSHAEHVTGRAVGADPHRYRAQAPG